MLRFAAIIPILTYAVTPRWLEAVPVDYSESDKIMQKSQLRLKEFKEKMNAKSREAEIEMKRLGEKYQGSELFAKRQEIIHKLSQEDY